MRLRRRARDSSYSNDAEVGEVLRCRSPSALGNASNATSGQTIVGLRSSTLTSTYILREMVPLSGPVAGGTQLTITGPGRGQRAAARGQEVLLLRAQPEGFGHLRARRVAAVRLAADGGGRASRDGLDHAQRPGLLARRPFRVLRADGHRLHLPDVGADRRRLAAGGARRRRVRAGGGGPLELHVRATGRSRGTPRCAVWRRPS